MVHQDPKKELQFEIIQSLLKQLRDLPEVAHVMVTMHDDMARFFNENESKIKHLMEHDEEE